MAGPLLRAVCRVLECWSVREDFLNSRLITPHFFQQTTSPHHNSLQQHTNITAAQQHSSTTTAAQASVTNGKKLLRCFGVAQGHIGRDPDQESLQEARLEIPPRPQKRRQGEVPRCVGASFVGGAAREQIGSEAHVSTASVLTQQAQGIVPTRLSRRARKATRALWTHTYAVIHHNGPIDPF